MISEIFGLCGSGKSLMLSFIADRALKDKSINYKSFHLSDNRHYDYILSNFTFKGCYKLDFDTLGYTDYHDCLMLIDEIMLLADCRNFKSYGENLKIFFSQHRKKHIDIVYATQYHNDVDKKIRNITDNLYYVDKFIFNCSRVRRIEPFFNVGKLETSYNYAPPAETMFFYRPLLFKRLEYNTDEIINKKSEFFNSPVVFNPW